MFAVIKTGGKQYRVNAGDRVKVESLPNEVGQQVTLSEVLAVGDGTRVRIGAIAQRGCGCGHHPGAWPPRQGQDIQNAPAQAFSEARGPSSELYRASHRFDRLRATGRLLQVLGFFV